MPLMSLWTIFMNMFVGFFVVVFLFVEWVCWLSENDECAKLEVLFLCSSTCFFSFLINFIFQELYLWQCQRVGLQSLHASFSISHFNRDLFSFWDVCFLWLAPPQPHRCGRPQCWHLLLYSLQGIKLEMTVAGSLSWLQEALHFLFKVILQLSLILGQSGSHLDEVTA